MTRARPGRRPRVVPVFVAGHGCPLRCTYCDQSGQTGARARVRREEVAAAVARSRTVERGPVELAFYGGTFTALPAETQEELLGAAGEQRRAGRVVAVRISTHPSWLRREHLARLAAGGVETVEVGVQSLDDRVLRASGRGTTAAETLAALRRVRASGFRLGVQLMPGLPGADRVSDRRTAEGLAGVGACLARVYPSVVLRGTALAAAWQRGDYEPLTTAEAVRRSADQVEALERAGCRVQRIGLHLDENLRAHAVAGPLEPALGEQVRAEIVFRRLREAVAATSGAVVTARVPSRELSRWIGYRRNNVLRLPVLFPGREVRIEADAGLPAGRCVVEPIGTSRQARAALHWDTESGGAGRELLEARRQQPEVEPASCPSNR